MKTNRKLQLLAVATVAMLAINPAARAQTPAPLSDEMLLHALATGQIPTSQLGAGGGDDENVANPGTASVIVGGIGIDYAATESYGGGLYLQGGTAPNYGGANYNTTADSQPFLGWYNDVYNVAAAQGSVAGFKDADGTAADLHTTDDYGGGLYLQGQPAASYGGAIYLNNAPVTGGNGFLDSDGSRADVASGSFDAHEALSLQQMAVYPGIYKATAGAAPVNSWYNDFYGNVSAPNPNSGFKDSDGSTADLHATTTTTYGGVLYIQGQPTVSYGGAIYNTTTAGASSVISIGDACDMAPALQGNGPMTVNYGGAAYLQSQPTAFYGGAIYHSTASSLYGEDLPGEALWGEDLPGEALWGEELPGEALWGEELPGEALTDAQLDALILKALVGVCDDVDNCPVAPVRR